MYCIIFFINFQLFSVNQNIQVFDQKCSKCLDAPGGPNCYDSGSGDVHCICAMGYDGPNCDQRKLFYASTVPAKLISAHTEMILSQ